MEPSNSRNLTVAALGLAVLGTFCWRGCSSADGGPVHSDSAAEVPNLDPPLPQFTASEALLVDVGPAEDLVITREPVATEEPAERELQVAPLVCPPDFQQFVDFVATGDKSLANQLLRLDWSQPEHRELYASWGKSFAYLPDLEPFGAFTGSARTLIGAVFLASCAERNAEGALQWQSPEMISRLGIAALERRGAIHHANMSTVPDCNPDTPRPKLDLPTFNDSVLAESRDLVLEEELLLISAFLQHNGYFVDYCTNRVRTEVEIYGQLQDPDKKLEAVRDVVWSALPLVVLARPTVSPVSLAMHEAHEARGEIIFGPSRNTVLPHLGDLALRFTDHIGGYNQSTGKYVVPATPAERFFTSLQHSLWGGIPVDILIDPRHPAHKPIVKGVEPQRASRMITQWQQGVLSNPQALFAAELMRFELLLNPQGIALDRLWPSWAHNDPTLITIASRRARCLSGPGAAEALGGYLFPTAGATAPNDLAASAELLRTFLLRGADGPAARLANELVKDPRTFGDQSRQGVGAVTAVTLEVARRSNDAAYLRSMLACVAAQDNYFFEADQVEGTIDFIFNFVRQPHADMRKVLDSLTAAPNTKHALVLAIALSGEKSGDISGNAALAQSRQRILAHVAGTDPEQSVSRLAVLGLLVGGSADDKLAGLGQAVLDAQERAVGQMFLNALSGVQKIIAPHCSDIGSVTADKPEPSAAEVASNVWLLFVLPQEACAASLGDMAKIVGNRFVQVEEPSQVLNGSYLMLPPRYLERLVRAAGKELQELSVN